MRHLQRVIERIPAPLLGVAVLGLLGLAWASATNTFDSDVKVSGDFRVTQAAIVTQTLTAADITSTDDMTCGDDLTVSGKAAITESVYVASKLTSASIIKAAAIVWTPLAGALPDTDSVTEGYTVVRNDTMFTRKPSDDGWMATEFQ